MTQVHDPTSVESNPPAAPVAGAQKEPLPSITVIDSLVDKLPEAYLVSLAFAPDRTLLKKIASAIPELVYIQSWVAADLTPTLLLVWKDQASFQKKFDLLSAALPSGEAHITFQGIYRCGSYRSGPFYQFLKRDVFQSPTKLITGVLFFLSMVWTLKTEIYPRFFVAPSATVTVQASKEINCLVETDFPVVFQVRNLSPDATLRYQQDSFEIQNPDAKALSSVATLVSDERPITKHDIAGGGVGIINATFHAAKSGLYKMKTKINIEAGVLRGKSTIDSSSATIKVWKIFDTEIDSDRMTVNGERCILVVSLLPGMDVGGGQILRIYMPLTVRLSTITCDGLELKPTGFAHEKRMYTITLPVMKAFQPSQLLIDLTGKMTEAEWKAPANKLTFVPSWSAKQ